MMDHNQRLKELRQAFADYVASEGCSCCQDGERHAEAAGRIGKLLRVPKFEDGSGYDFWKYQGRNK